MIGVYAILGVDAHGWGSRRTLGFGAAALGLLAVFIVRQARIADPLLPLRLFRSRDLSAANAVQVLLAPGLFGMFFLGALYMRRVLGYDPLHVGLAAAIALSTLREPRPQAEPAVVHPDATTSNARIAEAR